MSKKKIAIVFGGRSSEHDVSLMSAASVIRAIDKERYELVYIGSPAKASGKDWSFRKERTRLLRQKCWRTVPGWTSQRPST